MGKLYLIFFISILTYLPVRSQPIYKTGSGTVTFFSKAPLEDIKANNQKVRAALNLETGDILIKLKIEDFVFRKALMQKHFNENYMESRLFPESQFSGKIVGLNEDVLKSTPSIFLVQGNLTIHGVTRKIVTNATIKINQGSLVCESVFKVKVSDYDIQIPKLLTRNIAEEVEIIVNLNLKQ